MNILKMMSPRIKLIIHVLLFVRVSDTGECCTSFYDLTLTYTEERWCETYCCGASVLGTLYCCSDIFIQAPDADRTTFCSDYFDYLEKITWVPILIALGCIGIIISCIVCCCCCCCYGHYSHKSSGASIAPLKQPYHTNLTMLPATEACVPQQLPPADTRLSGAYGPPALPLPGPLAGQQTARKHPFDT